MEITRLICDYMQTNRRLTVPGLGSFLSREEDSGVIFSEFVKIDDGVLKKLMIDRGEMTSEEAEARIKAFAEQISALFDKGTGRIELPYLGTLLIAANSIEFNYDPSVGVAAAQAAEKAKVQAEARAKAKAQAQAQAQAQSQAKAKAKAEAAERKAAEKAAEKAAKKANRQLFKDSMKEVYEGYREFDINEMLEQRGYEFRVDPLVVFMIFACLLALSSLIYGFAVSWLVGEITLPEPFDSIMAFIML